jgi:hypothetical protein
MDFDQENRAQISAMKARAMRDPQQFDEKGKVLKVPNKPNRAVLLIGGSPISVVFTKDTYPSGRYSEHVSMRGLMAHPLSKETQAEIIRLVFGDEASQAQYCPPDAPSHHWVLWRTPPDQAHAE